MSLIGLVAELITKNKKERTKDGRELSYGDFMVLCPTRVISNTFAKRLKEKWKIPVRKITPRSIPDDLWRILLVLRMAERDDNLALRQWLEILEISRNQSKQLRDTAISQRRTLFEVVTESKAKKLKRFVKELDELREASGDMPTLVKKAKFLAGVTMLPFEPKTDSLSSLIGTLYEEYGLLERRASFFLVAFCDHF